MYLDLRTPESVEQTRRSLAMLAPRAWALRREAEQVLAVLVVALRELQRIEEAARTGLGQAAPRARTRQI